MNTHHSMTLVPCDGKMDAFGRCQRCGQHITSTAGSHYVKVAVTRPADSTETVAQACWKCGHVMKFQGTWYCNNRFANGEVCTAKNCSPIVRPFRLGPYFTTSFPVQPNYGSFGMAHHRDMRDEYEFFLDGPA